MWCPRRKAVVLKSGVLARGLVKTLQCLWYPHYKAPKGGGSVTPRKARAEGKALDGFVERWVKAGQTPVIRTVAAQRLVDALNEKGYKPIQAQVVATDEMLRLGTRVDLICEDAATNQKIFIEVKLGFDQYWRKCKADAKMNSPYDDLVDAAEQHHWLQAAWSRYLLEQQTPDTKIHQAYILRISRQDALPPHEWSLVPETLIRPPALQALQACKSQNKRQRSRSLSRQRSRHGKRVKR